MTKPFRFEELLSRVKLRLRGTQGVTAAPSLVCGDLTLDVNLRTAEIGGRVIDLSAREFVMARTFMENAGRVLSREQLLSRVWGYHFEGSSNVVDVYVRYLRHKLGAERIQTIRGVGYRLMCTPAPVPGARAADETPTAKRPAAPAAPAALKAPTTGPATCPRDQSGDRPDSRDRNGDPNGQEPAADKQWMRRLSSASNPCLTFAPHSGNTNEEGGR